MHRLGYHSDLATSLISIFGGHVSLCSLPSIEENGDYDWILK